MTGRGLDATVRALILGDELPGPTSSEAIRLAHSARLFGLLLMAAAADESLLSRPARLELARRDLLWRGVRTRHVERLANLRAELAPADLFVFKGVWNAATLYENELTRPASDIDLHVGHWSEAERRRAYERLGVPRARADAIERPTATGRPLHEFKVVGEPPHHPNIDVHMNPLGLVGVWGTDVRAHGRRFDVAGIGEVLGPTPAFALLIALTNLSRKGGMHLLGACDAVRLLQGSAGPVDWSELSEIAGREKLTAFTTQALWALADDLLVEFDSPFPRPHRRSAWTAELGVVRPIGSGGTAANLWRGRDLRPRHIAEFFRWYAPGPTQLRARSDDESAGPLSRFGSGVRGFVATRSAGGFRR